MKKLPALVCLMFVLSAWPAQAQNQNQPSQAPQGASSSAPPASVSPKATAPATFDSRTPAEIEVSFGPTFRTYNGALGRVGMYGGYGSADYNIFRWLGASAEILGAYRQVGARSIGTQQTYALGTAMVGPQFYPIFHHRVTPFGHFLAGVGGLHCYTPGYAGFPRSDQNSVDLAYEAGVGVDLRIKAHWSIRLIQADYGSTSFPGTRGGQSSTRFSAGVVYLRGQK